MHGSRILRLATLVLGAGLSAATAVQAQEFDVPMSPTLSGLSVDAKATADVYAIDGGRVGKPITASGPGAREGTLLPGRHAVSGRMSSGAGLSFYSVDVDFEPGKRYVLYSSVRGYETKVDVLERGLPRPPRQPPSPLPPVDPNGEAASLELGQFDDTYTKGGSMVRGLIVTWIDDEQIVSKGFWKIVHTRKVPMKPGKHRIALQFMDTVAGQPMVGNAVLWVVAQPGERYFAKYRADRGFYNVWLEDANGSKVGGIAWSEDEPK